MSFISEPVHLLLACLGRADLAILVKLAPAEIGMLTPQTDQIGRELEQRLLPLIQIPMRPADFVVLAIGVIVSVLRPADLVAAADHRNALREKERHQ